MLQTNHQCLGSEVILTCQETPRNAEDLLSIQAYSWAIDQQLIDDPITQLVLMCLSYYAGADGSNAFPSVARLARNTRLSERSVQNALRKLIRMKVLVKGNAAVVAAHIEREDRRPHVYNIVIPRGAPDSPRESTGCTSRPNGVHVTTERGAPPAPDPSSEPSINKKRARVIPKDSRAAEEATKRKILDAMHDLRLGSTARDSQAIAWRANVDVVLVRAHLAESMQQKKV